MGQAIAFRGLSGYMQCRTNAPAAMRPHHNLNILIERNEKTQESLNRKLPEFTAQHPGDIGLLDAEKRGSLNLLQTAPAPPCAKYNT